MKTIHKISLLLLAATFSAPVAFGDEPTVPETPAGVVLGKTTTEVGTNKYQIDLEAYVTGRTQTIITEEHTAADIVLVLDFSTSMDQSITTETTYNARRSQGYSYSGYGTNNYFYLYDGKYYPVKRTRVEGEITHFYYLSYSRSNRTYYLTGTSSSSTQPKDVTSKDGTIWTGSLYTRDNRGRYNKVDSKAYSYNTFGNQTLYYYTNSRYYQVSRHEGDITQYTYVLSFVDDNDVEHYLSGTGITETIPTDVTEEGATIWTGVLYQGQSGSDSKINILRAAVKDFIDVVAADAEKYDVDHRISIVTFNRTATLRSGLTTEYESLKTLIDRASTGNWTLSNTGMETAEGVLAGIGDGRTSSRVVVMFTDGQPTNTSSSRFNTNTANAAIKSSYNLINEYDATVYTVGIFGNLGDDATNVNTYMNYVSSNYPDAQSMTNGGTKKDTKYYQLSNGSDLSDIFTSIAKESTTGGATAKLDKQSTTVVDVLGVDFRLQPGMDVSKVQLFLVEPVSVSQDMEGNQTFSFETDESKWINAKTKFSDISVGIDEGKKEIVIGNYDFSGNYVSQVLDKDNKPTGEFTGYKLVIRFPIEIDPASPGGADVETNQISSGIYYNGEQIAAFNVPHAKIPNIVVVKKGLHKGESATFTISRADWNTGAHAADYPDIVMVATCKEEGKDAIARVKIQVPGRYTVTESTWSWAYDLSDVQSTYDIDDNGTITEAQWNAKLYGPKDQGYWATIPTITGTAVDKSARSITRNVNDFTEDPTEGYKGTLFVFTNKEKTDNPAHAEAIKNNEFYESRK